MTACRARGSTVQAAGVDMHDSLMWHFKKYAGRSNTVWLVRRQQKYNTELPETNYPISFHRGPDTLMVPFCWQPDGTFLSSLIGM